MAILFPIAMQTISQDKEGLHNYFNFMQMLLTPFLILLVWHSYKDFMRKKKTAWAIAYASLGIALLAINIYSLGVDFFRIWAIRDLLWAVLVIFLFALIFVSIMRFTVRCYYRKQKKKFIFMNIIFGAQLLFSAFMFFAILFRS
jgi:hypothetical protein